MKKTFILILVVLVNSSGLMSQAISLYNLDQSQFPLIKAKIFVLDNFGNIATGINKSDIVLTEDGVPREINSLECPFPKPPEALSAVLTIDVSGSMTGGGIQKAKAAANAWVQAIPLGKSECALTSFDSQNYLNCDFTNDRDRLLSAIEKLKPQGGTDYNAALINQMFGSLVLAERGKYKRTIVFLTDGYATGDENAIVQKAMQLNATIYCVVLGAKAPAVLKNIAARTGGEYYEEITTADDAAKCYKAILTRSQGGEPCSIEWMSDGCPDNRRVDVSVPKLNIATKDRYSVSFELLPKLLILPNNSLRFGPIEPGNYLTKKIKLISGQVQIKIDSITNDNKRFKVKDFPSGGVVLNPEDQLELTVEFAPFDSAYQFSRFNIHANACTGNYFYASGGYNGGKNNTLVITEPNGGESYAAGSDSTVRWDGIPEADTVKIEVSTDGGFRWQKITDYAFGLNHNYKLPNANSEKCLIRIKQLESSGSKLINFRAHSFFVQSIAISPDSKYIATCGEDRSFKIFEIATGNNVSTITSYLIYRLSTFSPDGSKLAVAMSDYSINIYSAQNWSLIKNISGASSWVEEMAFSSDGKKLATVSNDNGKRKVKIIDIASQASIFTNEHNQAINDIQPTADGKNVISASSDGTITIWDFNSGTEIKTISGGMNSYEAIGVSPEGSRLAVSANNGSKLCLIDIQSGQIVDQKDMTTGVISDLAWSFDGQSIAVATDKGYLTLYSGDTYDSLRSFRENSFKINDIEWSRDSKYLVAGTNDNFVRVWNFELVLQEAVSESYWTIVRPQYTATSIDFGKLQVGNLQDSIFSNFITNTGKVPMELQKYEIVGADSNSFSLISNLAPLSLVPNQSEFVELQFHPKRTGIHTADLKIYSQFDTTTVQILGEGFESKIRNLIKFVDFGKTAVDYPKDSLVKVFRNQSSSNLIIDSVTIIGPDLEQFNITAPMENYSIAAGAYLEVPFRFIPFDKGLSNTVAEIHYRADGSPAKLQLIGEGISDCGAESFYISDFSNDKYFNIIKSAKAQNANMILNQAIDQDLGGITTKKRIPVDSGFVATYSFKITDAKQFDLNETSEPGADGMSFVIHNSDNTKMGRTGGGVGYVNLKNALAIELDLFANDNKQLEDYKDPNGNHLAVFKIAEGDTVLSSIHKETNVMAINSNIPIIRSDGTVYYEKVEYKPESSELLVYLDSTGEFKSPAIRIDDFKLSDYIKMEFDKGVYLSVFATAGSSYQSHVLLSWRTCSYKSAESVPADVIENSQIPSEKINISPNPTDSKATLRINSDKYTKCVVSFFNALGDEIHNKIEFYLTEGKNEIALPEDLPQGTTFVKIEIDGISTVKNLIRFR